MTNEPARTAVTGMKPARLYALNLVGFIATSAFCYQGAMRGIPWLGLAAVGVQMALLLPMSGGWWKARSVLTLGVGLFGFVLDSVLVAAGVYTAVPETRWYLPAPLCPEWVLALWLNFGFMLFLSWRNLRGKVWLGALCGLVFAFMIYGGARRHGMIEVASPAGLRIGVIAVLWAVVVPVLARVAGRLATAGSKGVQS